MNEEMRKEFEEFMFNFLGVNVNENRGITPSGHDGYVFECDDSTMVCTVAWLAWQASREAMKPIKIKQSTLMLFTRDVVDAIKQVGYKVE